MPTVRCEIVRWVADEPQPGLVEARLVDADGRVWTFIDKEPMFAPRPLRQPRTFPVPAIIRCQVLEREQLPDGREVVTIDTATPDGLESEGNTIFRVLVEAVDGG